MDSKLDITYIKIDGKPFDNPLPTYEHDDAAGRWVIVVEEGSQSQPLTSRHGLAVDVEIGTQQGILRGSGTIDWFVAGTPNAMSFYGKVEGTQPLKHVEG